MWLGAAIFFSASVAPNVFQVLRGAGLTNASTLAGSIISPLLATLNRAGFEIAIFLLVMSYFLTRGHGLIRKVSQMTSLAIMAIATAIGHWVIASRIAALRSATVIPIDQLAPDDARHLAFDSLHSYSVFVFAVAILSAAVAFFIMATAFRRSAHAVRTVA